ncbi:hypothetical protein SAMN05421841_1854 [Chryseobacterium wanjuense]|uniref:Uncharacterized protein n=1 Tax=Chryseobacterium wanjuense TaxID=356305 RepID=A0A1I0QEN4_9FLAO|nr:hypothetical protein [Chryseobacterium wanjuense]SEW25468.1 hypothetical protein SAMN05421841_1854 [Chryseobacterium wanjuense]
MKSTQHRDALIDAFQRKGFTNMFMSERDSPGTLKEIIDDYLKSIKDTKAETIPDLWLSTYLHWNGEDQSYIVCNLWMNLQKENPVISKMITEKKNGQAAPLNKSELINISIDSLPTTKELMALVESSYQKKGKSRRL